MSDRQPFKETSSEIGEFFAGQSVLITGGTGFIGAVLLEKLLRACPEIAAVYLLIRPKRLVGVHDRLGALFETQVCEFVFTQRLNFPAIELGLRK
jgi:fatty acyl-CoA reductase